MSPAYVTNPGASTPAGENHEDFFRKLGGLRKRCWWVRNIEKKPQQLETAGLPSSKLYLTLGVQVMLLQNLDQPGVK